MNVSGDESEVDETLTISRAEADQIGRLARALDEKEESDRPFTTAMGRKEWFYGFDAIQTVDDYICAMAFADVIPESDLRPNEVMRAGGTARRISKITDAVLETNVFDKCFEQMDVADGTMCVQIPHLDVHDIGFMVDPPTHKDNIDTMMDVTESTPTKFGAELKPGPDSCVDRQFTDALFELRNGLAQHTVDELASLPQYEYTRHDEPYYRMDHQSDYGTRPSVSVGDDRRTHAGMDEGIMHYQYDMDVLDTDIAAAVVDPNKTGFKLTYKEPNVLLHGDSDLGLDETVVQIVLAVDYVVCSNAGGYVVVDDRKDS